MIHQSLILSMDIVYVPLVLFLGYMIICMLTPSRIETFDEAFVLLENWTPIYTMFRFTQCHQSNGLIHPKTYYIDSQFKQYHYYTLKENGTHSLFGVDHTPSINTWIRVNQNGTVHLNIDYLDYEKNIDHADEIICQLNKGVSFHNRPFIKFQ
jgi:hypothetical protein